MRKNLYKLLFCSLYCIALTGCSSTTKTLLTQTGAKNVNIDGCIMSAQLESASIATNVPQGKLLIGNAAYRSRRVGIPIDQKVPVAVFFRAERNTSIFGTGNIVLEYDFTADSVQTANVIANNITQQCQEISKTIFVPTAAGSEK